MRGQHLAGPVVCSRHALTPSRGHFLGLLCNLSLPQPLQLFGQGLRSLLLVVLGKDKAIPFHVDGCFGQGHAGIHHCP